jgi:hypothetical protein
MELQSIALAGVCLGAGILIGSMLGAERIQSMGSKRKNDTCSHEWQETPEGYKCSKCPLKRRKERRK